MARVRNSFVETTCIPKRKITPPRREVSDIGLIIRHAVIPCVSAEEAFSIYIV